MEVIEEIYQKIINTTDRDFTKQEFGDLVEEKIEELGGLCDKETAAKLIARDFNVNPEEKFVDVGEITEDMERVSFVGKVVEDDEINTFEREDGSIGRVANLTLADESGKIRVVLWDEDADLVKLGEIEKGDVLRVQRGQVKDGYSGLEVNLSNVSDISREKETDFDVEGNERTLIGDLEEDMGSVHVFGEVIRVGEVREFENENGKGRVRSIKLGDESGKINVNLWGDHNDLSLEKKDKLKIKYGYTRERYGEVELNVGYRGKAELKDEGVSYEREITPLSEVSDGHRYDVKGKVTGIQDIHYFERKDGDEGKVSNIYLRDDSGEKRVALWGEKADFVEEIEAGDVVLLEDAKAKLNNGEVELSIGFNSEIEKLSTEKEKITDSIASISGGELVEVTGTVIDEDIVDDGKGSIWVKGDLPSIGSRVKVIGESLVEKNRLIVRAEEIKKLSYGEEELKDLSNDLLKEIEEN